MLFLQQHHTIPTLVPEVFSLSQVPKLTARSCLRCLQKQENLWDQGTLSFSCTNLLSYLRTSASHSISFITFSQDDLSVLSSKWFEEVSQVIFQKGVIRLLK